NLDARNVASQKLCERVGMRKEAHFLRDYWNKNEWTDSMVYAMLHEEFVR
ncbi:MAG: GNAT family N-acetyltransferase, partial [Exiguobacterium profundum]